VVVIQKLCSKISLYISCSASNSDRFYTFSVARSFCPSVSLSAIVCHIRAPCLNRWTELPVGGIWQVHFCDPTTHCLRWKSGPWLQEKGIFGVKLLAKTCSCFRLTNEDYFCCTRWQYRLAILHFTKLLWCL